MEKHVMMLCALRI